MKGGRKKESKRVRAIHQEGTKRIVGEKAEWKKREQSSGVLIGESLRKKRGSFSRGQLERAPTWEKIEIGGERGSTASIDAEGNAKGS